MLAITQTEFGPAHILKLTNEKMLKNSPDKLLIKVEAFGLNRADILQRQGKYNPPQGESLILGLELSGTVENAPSDSSFKRGDRVCALVGGGAYAEYCYVDEKLCVKIPDDMSFEVGAAIVESYLTAYHLLLDKGQMKQEAKVLIHAAASSVGISAIQLALHFKASEIYVTCGSEAKCVSLLKLGVTKAINYKKEDFLTQIKENNLDLILDPVGKNYFSKNLKVLNKDGSLVLYATMSGSMVETDLLDIIYKRLNVRGFVLRSQTLEAKQKMFENFKKSIFPLITNQSIKPIIDCVYSWKNISEAHSHMEANKNIGKIVILTH